MKKGDDSSSPSNHKPLFALKSNNLSQEKRVNLQQTPTHRASMSPEDALLTVQIKHKPEFQHTNLSSSLPPRRSHDDLAANGTMDSSLPRTAAGKR